MTFDANRRRKQFAENRAAAKRAQQGAICDEAVNYEMNSDGDRTALIILNEIERRLQLQTELDECVRLSVQVRSFTCSMTLQALFKHIERLFQGMQFIHAPEGKWYYQSETTDVPSGWTSIINAIIAFEDEFAAHISELRSPAGSLQVASVETPLQHAHRVFLAQGAVPTSDVELSPFVGDLLELLRNTLIRAIRHGQHICCRADRY